MNGSALSVYLVLSLGAVSGGVVKGVTGFGNAIINLLVWVTFTAADVDAGPLQLAVLADSVGCVVCSIPLLLMTSAHKTADWRLVVTLLLFTTAGAPLGAALLTHLPARWVELVMACVLLLVICLHVKLHETLARALRNWRASRRLGTYKGLLDEDSKAPGQGRDGGLGAAGAPAHDGGTGSTDAPNMSYGLHAQAALDCIAVDCLSSAVPSRRPSSQIPDQLLCALLPGLASASVVKHGAGDSRVSIPSSAAAAAEAAVRLGASPSADLAPAGSAAAAEATAAAVQTGVIGAGVCGRPPKDPWVGSSDPDGPKYGDSDRQRCAAVVQIRAVCCCGDGDAGVTAEGRACTCAAVAVTIAVHSNEGGALLKPAQPSEGASSTVSSDMSAVSEMQPLLGGEARSSDAAPRRPAACLCGSGGGGSGGNSDYGSAGTACCGDGAGCRALLAGLRRWASRQDWREMRRIMMVGSVAGLASGVMGGMTGIGGPPIMFMYEKLKVAKEVVRGTNAVNNVLQVRLISYIVMGVFKRQDLLLYAVTSAVGLVGVFVGNALAGRLNQKGFSRVLVALMVICCVLLFVSAAGLKGHATR